MSKEPFPGCKQLVHLLWFLLSRNSQALWFSFFFLEAAILVFNLNITGHNGGTNHRLQRSMFMIATDWKMKRKGDKWEIFQALVMKNIKQTRMCTFLGPSMSCKYVNCVWIGDDCVIHTHANSFYLHGPVIGTGWWVGKHHTEEGQIHSPRIVGYYGSLILNPQPNGFKLKSMHIQFIHL